MAHGIKTILIDKKEELECNNNQQQTSINMCKSKMALNNLLLDNCCHNLLNQKNSSTTNTNALATTATHQTQPPPTQSSTVNNKLSLNSSGASMSTATATAAQGTKMGSRRIFTPQFKLQVLESYRNDNDCKGNQRATARKYGIHRRQIQKWLQCENNLRSIIANNPQNVRNNPIKAISKAPAPILSSSTSSRQRGVINTDKNGGTYSCFSLTNVKNFKVSNNVVGSSSSSSSAASTKSLSSNNSSNSSATAYETNNKYLILNNSNGSGYSSIYCNTTDDLPIDLSCHPTKIKIENVARPIPLHPSASNYQIPFFNFSSTCATMQQPQLSATPSPRLIDISHSVVKSELIDPIDLSIPNVSHKRKLSTDNNNRDDNKKPIKLFRPYLESNFDSDEKEEAEEKEQQSQDAQKFPIIWSNAYNFYPDHIQPPPPHPADYPFLMSTSPSFYSDSHLHHPHSPNDSGIVMSTTYHSTQLLPPSQASPVSGYDSSTSSIYSFNDNEVDLSQGHLSPTYTSSHYDPPSPSFSSATMSPVATETKVPLSSSSFLHDLKFKLHALDCYYNDADCKRNEKLVANKLNINCKVVEKWLRQESDLRHQQKQYHLQILV